MNMVCIHFRNVIVTLGPSYGIHRVTSRSPPPLTSATKTACWNWLAWIGINYSHREVSLLAYFGLRCGTLGPSICLSRSAVQIFASPTKPLYANGKPLGLFRNESRACRETQREQGSTVSVSLFRISAPLFRIADTRVTHVRGANMAPPRHWWVLLHWWQPGRSHYSSAPRTHRKSMISHCRDGPAAFADLWFWFCMRECSLKGWALF